MKIYIAHNQVTSRWITDDSHDQVNGECAQADLDDIDRADALLLFVDQYGDRPGKGKYVELGYALGTGKKCYLIGKDDGCVFYHLPQVTRVATLEELPHYASMSV